MASQGHIVTGVSIGGSGLNFGVSKALLSLLGLRKGLINTQRETKKLVAVSNNSVGKVYQSLGGLGALFVAHKIKAYIDAWTEAENRARIFGKTLQKALVIQQQMYEVAQAARLEFDGAVRLYARLAIIQKDLSLSFKEIQSIVGGVGKSLVVSGTTALQARGALIQFTQALGAGIVRAEEMNALLEGALRIVQAVARNIPKYQGSVAALRKDVVSGNVTSKQFVDAFLKGIPEIAAEFKLVRPTIQQGLTVLTNSIIRFVGRIDQLTGLSTNLANSLIYVSKNLDEIGLVLGALASVFVATKLTAGIKHLYSFFSDVRKISKLDPKRISKLTQAARKREVANPNFVTTRDGGPLGRYVNYKEKVRAAGRYITGGSASVGGAVILSKLDFGGSDTPSAESIKGFNEGLPKLLKSIIYTGYDKPVREDPSNPKSSTYFYNKMGVAQSIAPENLTSLPLRHKPGDVFPLGERAVKHDYIYKAQEEEFKKSVKELDQRIIDVVNFTGVDKQQLINSIRLPTDDAVQEQLKNLPKGLHYQKTDTSFRGPGNYPPVTGTTKNKIQALLEQFEKTGYKAGKLGYPLTVNMGEFTKVKNLTKDIFGKGAKGLMSPAQLSVYSANTGFNLGGDPNNVIVPTGSDFSDEKKSLDAQTKLVNLMDTIFPRFKEFLDKLEKNIIPGDVALIRFENLKKAINLAKEVERDEFHRFLGEGKEQRILDVGMYKYRKEDPVLKAEDDTALAIKRTKIDTLFGKLTLSAQLANEKRFQSRNIPEYMKGPGANNIQEIIKAHQNSFYKTELRRLKQVGEALSADTKDDKYRVKLAHQTRSISGISPEQTANLLKSNSANNLLIKKDIIKQTLAGLDEIYRISQLTAEEQEIEIAQTRLLNALGEKKLDTKTRQLLVEKVLRNIPIEAAGVEEKKRDILGETLKDYDEIYRVMQLSNKEQRAAIALAKIKKSLGGVDVKGEDAKTIIAKAEKNFQKTLRLNLGKEITNQGFGAGLSFNEEARKREIISHELRNRDLDYTEDDVTKIYNAREQSAKNARIYTNTRQLSSTPAFSRGFQASGGDFNERIRRGQYEERVKALQTARSSSQGALSGDDYQRNLEQIKRSFPEFQSQWDQLILSMESSTKRWGNLFADTLTTAFATGKLSFKDFATSIITDLIRMITQSYITGPLFQLIGSFLPGIGGGAPTTGRPSYPAGVGRARGGSIRGRSAYVVGEEGPEVFIPSSSGLVIPNSKINLGQSQMMGGSRQTTNNVSLKISVDQNGASSSTGNSNSEELHAVGNLIAARVADILDNEQLPGGRLYRG